MTALESLKAHLNILDDTDNSLLSDKLDAALAFTTRQIGADEEIAWETAPADIRQAVLMLAGWWYEQRESGLVEASAYSVPFGYIDIVLPHRNWTF